MQVGLSAIAKTEKRVSDVGLVFGSRLYKATCVVLLSVVVQFLRDVLYSELLHRIVCKHGGLCELEQTRSTSDPVCMAMGYRARIARNELIRKDIRVSKWCSRLTRSIHKRQLGEIGLKSR